MNDKDAKATIEKAAPSEMISLTHQEAKRFIAMLETPTIANENLKQLFNYIYNSN